MTELPESILIECLDLLEEGMSISQILGRYPQYQAALRPYLETAVEVSKFAPRPTHLQKQTSQQAFLKQAASLKAAAIPQKRPRLLWRRVFTPLAGLALFLLLFSVFAVNASSAALPGDGLYNVKRLVENAQIQLAGSPEVRLELIAKFKEERIREVAVLLRSDRMADIEFDGLIEEISEDRWLISGIQTEISDSTVIEGKPAIDALARVNGRVANGRLQAATILVLTLGSSPEPTNVPQLEETSTPTATVAGSVTETSTHTATPTQTVTTSSTPSPTASGTPTATAVPVTPEPTNIATSEPLPAPTATPPPAPTSDDNGNENGDDNGNDNDNENEDDNENEEVNENEDNSGSGNDNDNENDNDSSGPGSGNDNGSNDNDGDNDNH